MGIFSIFLLCCKEMKLSSRSLFYIKTIYEIKIKTKIPVEERFFLRTNSFLEKKLIQQHVSLLYSQRFIKL